MLFRKGIKGTRSWVSGIESHLAVVAFFSATSKIIVSPIEDHPESSSELRLLPSIHGEIFCFYFTK